MTAYRTLAFDSESAAYHGGDAGWIRHANSGNLSRPSLEPDLSDLPLVTPVTTARFGRRMQRARHAPNVLGDLPLVMPVSTDRFGRRMQRAQFAPNVLGDYGEGAVTTASNTASTVNEIADVVKAAAAIATTGYGLYEQNQDKKKAQAQASSAQAAAATAQQAATDAQAKAVADAKAGAGSPLASLGNKKTLLYVAGGIAAVVVLAMLFRGRSVVYAPSPAPAAR